MDTNFQPTPDQPESTQPVPLAQKSSRGLLMAVGALLLLSLLANVYFFSKLNQPKMVDQPDGPQIPVVQTETEPTANISETPGSETTASPDVDEMQGWKTLKTDYFQVKYPSDIKVEDRGNSTIRLQKIGPTQKEGTELYDGINLNFQTVNVGENTVTQYAKKNIDATKFNQTGEVLKDIEPIKLALNSGVTYTVSGLGTHTYYIFSVNKIGSTMVLEIIDSTSDPTNQGYQATVNKILNTLEIY